MLNYQTMRQILDFLLSINYFSDVIQSYTLRVYDMTGATCGTYLLYQYIYICLALLLNKQQKFGKQKQKIGRLHTDRRIEIQSFYIQHISSLVKSKHMF